MSDYERIAATIRFLERHRTAQPELSELAEHLGISRFHLQRLFSRWAGVSPKAFLKCLTVAHAKTLLRSGSSVLDAALETGLSGPSRLHDLCISLEAATPGEVKRGGAGWSIAAGFASSPFGNCLIGGNERGICHLSFPPSRSQPAAVAAIHADWPQAAVGWDQQFATHQASLIFVRPEKREAAVSFKALVRGTEFQVRVWRALLEIPPGALTCYSQVAETVCDRRATRAVASAIGRNSVAFLIPCHRVIRQTGAIGEYRWDSDRKQAMVAWETGARTSAD